MDKLFRGWKSEGNGKVEEKDKTQEVVNTFKEIAFNSRTKKTLVRDGNKFIVVAGTDKSFLDTLRTLRYLKFDSIEDAIEFFKKNGEEEHENQSV